MSPLRLNGSTSGYCQLDVPAVSGTSLLTVPAANGTLDRLERVGNILQVVNATYSTATTSSSSTYADTGLTASITPSSTSNKILVIVNQNGCTKYAENGNNRIDLKLLRGSTDLVTFGVSIGFTGTIAQNYVGSSVVSYLDTPGVTTSVTYKTQFANANGVASVGVQTNSSVSSIALLEVAA